MVTPILFTCKSVVNSGMAFMRVPSLAIRSHRHPKSQTDSGKTVNRFRLPRRHTSYRLRRWTLGGGVDRSDSVRWMVAAGHDQS